MSLLLITLVISSAFSFVIQADVFFGTSSGIDTGIVLGSGNFKNTIGLMIDTRDFQIEYSSNNVSKVKFFGIFYKYSFDTIFINLGSVGIGIDIGAFASLGIDSVVVDRNTNSDINCSIGLTPTIKIDFNVFELITGWRGELFIRQNKQDSTSVLKNSFILGAKFNISGLGHFYSQQNTQQTPGYEHNPIVKKIE